MSGQLKVLMVEDSEADAELALRELVRAGIACTGRRVDTVDAYRRELEHFRPDVILSDFTMPGFDGMEAFSLARQHDPDLSFIFVSGTIGEENAIRALKNGATDYVLKGNLVRLPSAVERAVRDAQARAKARRAERLLKLEHAVACGLGEALSVADALKLVIRAVCEAEGWTCGRYFAVDAGRLLRFEEGWGRADPSVVRFIERSQMTVFEPASSLAGQARLSGRAVWVADLARNARALPTSAPPGPGLRAMLAFPVSLEGQCIGVFCFNGDGMAEPDERALQTVRVIGSQVGQFLQRKRAEDVTRESESRFRSLTELSSDWYWEQDSEFRFAHISNALLEKSGINPSTRIGQRRWEIPTPNMTEADWAAHRAVLEGHHAFHDLELCRRADDGSLRYVSVSGEPIFDARGRFKGYRGIGKDITARKMAEERLAHLAQFDSLTGLPNRQAFQDRLVQEMAQAKRDGETMAVLFIDLDRFKLVNDTLGHGAGDKLLKEACERLASCVRTGDTIGRLGGDEFGALLCGLSRPGDAALVARKVIDALGRPFRLEGRDVHVSASIGIAVFPLDGEDAGTLIKNADAAMYRAKEQGRGDYRYFTPHMNERALARVQLEASLRLAAEREEFVLHYQPKVDLKSGKIRGLEALLRWRHPERGLVPPLQFVPVLEETGLIVPVGEWVLRRACADIKAWRDAGLSVPTVAVNLSARQLEHKGLKTSVRRILREAGLEPSCLQLELTESLLMQDPEHVARTLSELRQTGITLAVDDFGTGCSSLAYLRRFPLDALKIDRTFVRNVTVDPDAAAVARAVIGIARSLDLTVVAEGVETRAQLDFLRTHGCEQAQGQLFHKPAGADESAALLKAEAAEPLTAAIRN